MGAPAARVIVVPSPYIHAIQSPLNSPFMSPFVSPFMSPLTSPMSHAMHHYPSAAQVAAVNAANASHFAFPPEQSVNAITNFLTVPSNLRPVSASASASASASPSRLAAGGLAASASPAGLDGMGLGFAAPGAVMGSSVYGIPSTAASAAGPAFVAPQNPADGGSRAKTFEELLAESGLLDHKPVSDVAASMSLMSTDAPPLPASEPHAFSTPSEALPRADSSETLTNSSTTRSSSASHSNSHSNSNNHSIDSTIDGHLHAHSQAHASKSKAPARHSRQPSRSSGLHVHTDKPPAGPGASAGSESGALPEGRFWKVSRRRSTRCTSVPFPSATRVRLSLSVCLLSGPYHCISLHSARHAVRRLHRTH
ncbi:hypothetical protein BC831DRAFT_130344 [Entophlyctis helioformis]|nr:hypothetical protein BC831DRAFT_130344 [Entophlyctis helioformis]